MKCDLTVLIVNFNTSDFIKLSLYALDRLTKNTYKVYILDNGSNFRDYKKIKKICMKYDNVFLERWETDLRGSIAHGTALNHLVKKVRTTYFSILDADATWLVKNWDEILIKRMKRNVKVIGTQPPKLKPQGFPLMFAILFETKTFKELNIDFRPKDISKYQDTGYELREKYLRGKFKCQILRERNTRDFHNGPFRDIIVTEYYLDGKKEVFASHFWRGSTLGYTKYRSGENLSFIYKCRFISNPLIRLKGCQEKRKWIKICQGIIDEEAKEKVNFYKR